MNPTEEIAKQTNFWAEHGLPGLVIFTLFLMLAGFFWYSNKTNTTNTNAFVGEVKNARQDAKEFRAEHAEERKQMRESSEKQTDKLEGAIRDLTQALHNRQI